MERLYYQRPGTAPATLELPPAQVGMELRADVQSVGHTLFEEGLSSREG